MKKAIYGVAIAVIAVVIIISLSFEPKPQSTSAYHVTLADPKLTLMKSSRIILKSKTDPTSLVLCQMVTAQRRFPFH